MESITLVHTTDAERLMSLTDRKLEAWFDAGGLTVEVVTNCSDPTCPDCLALVSAREAA